MRPRSAWAPCPVVCPYMAPSTATLAVGRSTPSCSATGAYRSSAMVAAPARGPAPPRRAAAARSGRGRPGRRRARPRPRPPGASRPAGCAGRRRRSSGRPRHPIRSRCHVAGRRLRDGCPATRTRRWWRSVPPCATPAARRPADERRGRCAAATPGCRERPRRPGPAGVAPGPGCANRRCPPAVRAAAPRRRAPPGSWPPRPRCAGASRRSAARTASATDRSIGSPSADSSAHSNSAVIRIAPWPGPSAGPPAGPAPPAAARPP